MLLLEQDTIRKGRVETAIELNEGDNEEYEVKTICDNEVYAKESDCGHLPGLYYLVSWKGYPKKENIWEPALAVLHLHKLISTFYWDYPEKLTATSPPIDSAPPIVRLIVKPRAKALSTKQKRDRPVKDSGASKRAKKT